MAKIDPMTLVTEHSEIILANTPERLGIGKHGIVHINMEPVTLNTWSWLSKWLKKENSKEHNVLLTFMRIIDTESAKRIKRAIGDNNPETLNQYMSDTLIENCAEIMAHFVIVKLDEDKVPEHYLEAYGNPSIDTMIAKVLEKTNLGLHEVALITPRSLAALYAGLCENEYEKWSIAAGLKPSEAAAARKVSEAESDTIEDILCPTTG